MSIVASMPHPTPIVARMPSSPLLRDLYNDLRSIQEIEITQTLKVSVCLSSGLTRAETKRTLGISDTELKMSIQRLGVVADRWKNE